MFLLQFIKVSRFALSFLKEQKQYNQHFIAQELAPFEKKYNQKLSENALKKTYSYYCLGVPIVCAAYTRLYGRNLTEKELEDATLIGMLTPIIDDFTDEKKLTTTALDSLTNYPQFYKAYTLEEDIVKYILTKFINEVHVSKGFWRALQKVIEAQHWSLKQMQTNNTAEELLQICQQKGGWSYVFFHLLPNISLTNAEAEALFTMGSMLQMSNDIFDIYKDSKDGIATYVNTCSNFATLEQEYIAGCKNVCTLIKKLPLEKKNIDSYVCFNACALARAMVALQQLKKLQKRLGGGVLPFADLQRKQLICDMEKPINLLKLVWYSYKIFHY